MIKIGVAGVGTIANHYLNLIQTGSAGNYKITALSSRNLLNMRSAVGKNNLKDVQLFTNYEEMLKKGDIDAVLICTPHSMHPQMAIQAVQHEKHALIEKPIGVYIHNVDELIEELSRHPDLVAGVLFNRRASSAYQKINSLVKSGELGCLKRVTWIITNLYRTNVYYQNNPWRGSYQEEGGGLLMTQASHQLDLLVWICGMPKSVLAQCGFGVERPIQVENEAQIFLNYENNAVGEFIASSREFPGSNYLEISGSRGQLTLKDDFHLTFQRLKQDEREFTKLSKDPFGQIAYDSRTWIFDDYNDSLQHAATLKNFADAISGNTSIQCTVQEAKKSLQLIHATYLSAWLERPIQIPFSQELFLEEFGKRI